MNTSVSLRLALLGAIWGGSFALQRVAVPALGANLVSFGRLATAAAAMLVLLAVLHKSLDWRARWRDYLVLGALNSAIPFWLFAYAAPHLPAGYSAILNSTTPLFTVLVAWQAGSSPSWSKLLGVAVGVLGVSLIAGFGVVALNGTTALAFAGGLLAGFLYAIAALRTRRQFSGSDPLVVATGSLGASTLLLAPIALVGIGQATPTAPALVSLLLLGLVCTAIAYAIYFGLLRDAGPERATTVTLIVPIFAHAWGSLFLGEPITLADALGSALVLFAVALVFEKLRWPGRKNVVVSELAVSVAPKTR